MNLQDLEAFVAVAELGSVNRAAIRLNLTQPAATRRIQNFEAAIGGAPLFDRTVKPATLTAVGMQVLEHCRRVLAAVAELVAAASRGAALAGDLKAGIAHGFAEMVMIAPLDALRLKYPQVRPHVTSDWTADLIESVRGGAIDCAVGLLTEAHNLGPGLVAIALGSEEVVIVAPAAAFRKRDRPWRLRQLAAESWYLNPRGCGCRAALLRAAERQHLALELAAEIVGDELQLALVAHRGGLALVPRRQVAQSPHRRQLRVLEVADFVLPTTVALIRKATPSRFDAAIELLAAELEIRLR